MQYFLLLKGQGSGYFFTFFVYIYFTTGGPQQGGRQLPSWAPTWEFTWDTGCSSRYTGILAALPGIQGYCLFFQEYWDTGCSSGYTGILAALLGIQGYWLLFQVYRDTGCSSRYTGILAALPGIQGYWLLFRVHRDTGCSSRNTGILAALPGIQGYWLLFQVYRDTGYFSRYTGLLVLPDIQEYWLLSQVYRDIGWYISVLHQPVLHLGVSVLQQFVLPLDVSLQKTVLPKSNLCFHWTFSEELLCAPVVPVYKSLCCAYACPSKRALICNWTWLPSRAQPMLYLYVYCIHIFVCLFQFVSKQECWLVSNHNKNTSRRLEPSFMRRREPGRCRSAHPPAGSSPPFASGQYQTEWKRPSRKVVFVLKKRGGYIMCIAIIRQCALLFLRCDICWIYLTE